MVQFTGKDYLSQTKVPYEDVNEAGIEHFNKQQTIKYIEKMKAYYPKGAIVHNEGVILKAKINQEKKKQTVSFINPIHLIKQEIVDKVQDVEVISDDEAETESYDIELQFEKNQNEEVDCSSLTADDIIWYIKSRNDNAPKSLENGM